jgi:hypothetical protein
MEQAQNSTPFGYSDSEHSKKVVKMRPFPQEKGFLTPYLAISSEAGRLQRRTHPLPRPKPMACSAQRRWLSRSAKDFRTSAALGQPAVQGIAPQEYAE